MVSPDPVMKPVQRNQRESVQAVHSEHIPEWSELRGEDVHQPEGTISEMLKTLMMVDETEPLRPSTDLHALEQKLGVNWSSKRGSRRGRHDLSVDHHRSGRNS